MKNGLRLAFVSGSIALLSGCSSMDQGPIADTGPSVSIQSSSIAATIKRSDTVKFAQHYACPDGDLSPNNRCFAWTNTIFLGPVSYLGAREQTGISYTPGVVHYTRHPSNGGIFGLAGVFMPVTGIGSAIGGAFLASNLGSSNVGNPYGWGNSSNAFVDQAKLYNLRVAEFNTGQALWVIKYYDLPKSGNQWAIDLSSSSHHLASLAVDDKVQLNGWAGLSIDGVPYKPIGGNGIAGVFQYEFQGGKPATMPSLYPVAYYWVYQAWKNPQKAKIVVPGPSHAEPFTALAGMEYRIAPGFDIPAWIQKHQTQLTGWIVIYHRGDQDYVWKDGQTHSYPALGQIPVPAKG
jgi:hypothetical protein